MMDIIFDIFLVLVGMGLGIALVTLRTAQDTKRPDAEFTSERIEQ
jgi:hypothetical protein